MTFHATFLTLFPEAFPGPLGVSILQRGLDEGRWSWECVGLRNFGLTRHKNVDDTPAGGGAGMVMRADVIGAAIDSVERQGRPVLFMSPRGRALTQKRVRELADGPGAIVLCGRFEGLDERVIEARDMEEISIGDYVLAGGEVAAMALVEACVRLLPGVAGNEESLHEESFENGLLEHPQYTRPREWEGKKIPEILLSGDHRKIAEWRLEHAKALTKRRRPDLYAASQNQSASFDRPDE